MSTQIKLTKNTYRAEKVRLQHLQMFLPTLKLKKALLQSEVQRAMKDATEKRQAYEQLKDSLYASAGLFSIPLYIDITRAIKVQKIERKVENISGVEVPVVCDVILSEFSYSLLDTPIWIDTLISSFKEFIVSKILAEVAHERLTILENELRNVSIRVNLFEKKLIPETIQTIRKIAIF